MYRPLGHTEKLLGSMPETKFDTMHAACCLLLIHVSEAWIAHVRVKGEGAEKTATIQTS